MANHNKTHTKYKIKILQELTLLVLVIFAA